MAKDVCIDKNSRFVCGDCGMAHDAVEDAEACCTHQIKNPKTPMAKCDDCKKTWSSHVLTRVGDGETVRLLCDECFHEDKKPKTSPRKRKGKTLMEMFDKEGMFKKPVNGAMKTIQTKPAYYGITYPDGPDADTWTGCKKGEHLFDEVLSDNQHYLICDACGLEVHISKIVSH